MTPELVAILAMGVTILGVGVAILAISGGHGATHR